MRARGAYPATTPTSDSYSTLTPADTNASNLHPHHQQHHHHHRRSNSSSPQGSPTLRSDSPPVSSLPSTSSSALEQHEQRLAYRKGSSSSFSISSSSAYSGRTGGPFLAARTLGAAAPTRPQGGSGPYDQRDQGEFINVPTGMMLRERDHKHKDESNGTSLSGSRRSSMQSGAGFMGTRLSPKKVGIIAMVVLGLLTVGRWMVPATVDIVRHDHPLTPRDYLNASQTDPAPFDFCPIFGPGDVVAERRGQWGLLKSRLHQGSNARIQRVVQKALSGNPVTISVLGGSVSACHGAGDDPIHPKCYPSKFFEWWNSVFPHPASELTNGATRKSDSAYFAYCSGHHLPDKTDLVILEFDSSDPNDAEWLRHFELLVRSILVRPDMPAIIILGHFSPQIQAQSGFAGPELLHTAVAQFYDVPHISTKGLLYHDYLANPEAARSTFYTDPVLANPAGHDLLADVLISYMMQQVCDGWSATMGHAFDVPYMGADGTDSTTGGPNLFGGVGQRKGISPIQKESDGGNVGATDSKYAGLKVPLARLADRPSDILQFREIEPFCVSANDLINPLPPSLFYGSGWHDHHPTKGDGHDDMHYWYAEQPTSRLRVPIKLGAGDVAIYYLQAPDDQPLGTASCWVDDNVGGAVELSGVADVPTVMPTLTMIDRHVARGSHFVECQLLGVEGKPTPPFKILGIFTT